MVSLTVPKHQVKGPDRRPSSNQFRPPTQKPGISKQWVDRRLENGWVRGSGYWSLDTGYLLQLGLHVEEELDHVAVADLMIAADGAHTALTLDFVQCTGLDEFIG
jgi:hypothetical protein